MFRKLLAAGGIAILATSVALADPPEGKGKPDKGGGDDPPSSLEIGADSWDRKLGEWFVLTATNGTNFQRVYQQRANSYFHVEDIAPKAVGDLAIVNDYGEYSLVSWSIDASGRVANVDSTVFIPRDPGGSCPRFSIDGSRIYYATGGKTVVSVPTNDPLSPPRVEYTLSGPTDNITNCAPAPDGTMVASIARWVDNLQLGDRISRLPLGTSDPEQEIRPYETDFIVWKLDVGPLGSLAYGYRDPQGDFYLRYEHGGQSDILPHVRGARYDCNEDRLLYPYRHPRKKGPGWLIRDLQTGQTSDYPDHTGIQSADWYC